MAKLYLMLGYPGAGKTTTAEVVAQISGAVHLQSDRFRLALFPEPTFTQKEHDTVYGGLDYLTELLLASGVNVIYDANLNHYVHRKDKYDICARTQSQAILMWVQVDKEIAKSRATQEADSDPRRPYGNLRDEVFERLTDEIEPPQAGEPHIAIDGTLVSPDYIRQQLSSAQ